MNGKNRALGAAHGVETLACMELISSLFHKTKMGGYHSQLFFSSPVLRSPSVYANVAKHLRLHDCYFDTYRSLLGNRPGPKVRAKPLPSLLSERKGLATESWSFARFLAVAVLLLP
jgi:hypothetical protein